jgi:hypothetical protein
MSTFQGGTIYWSVATGAHVVYGAIGGEYAATAAERDAYGTSVQKILGLPIADERRLLGVTVARFVTFQGGTIYWSESTGAHVVYGAIRDAYFATAGEYDAYGTSVRQILGLPTSDERGTPDGIGRFVTFQGGSIYWTPGTGAHAVYGAILGRWAQMGYERSVLGYPISEEVAAPDGARVVNFQHGRITWTAAAGALEGVELAGIPGGSPQTDDTSCGPNSAARFLQYYGFNVTYEQIRAEVHDDGDLISWLKLGTRPSVLADEIRRYRPETQLEPLVDTAIGLNRILDLVAAGKPVIALVNPVGTSHDVGDFLGFTGGHLPDELHWIVVYGYDRAARTITFMDTTGVKQTWSFDTFYQRWDWSAGGAVGDVLTGDLKVQQRTIIY